MSLLTGICWHQKSKLAEAEEKGTFSIPRMLQEREKQKQKEYAERAEVSVEEITGGEIKGREARELTATDRAFLFQSSEARAQPKSISESISEDE